MALPLPAAPQSQVSPMVQMELLRRRASLGASSSGVQGGAATTNSQDPTVNSIPRDLQTSPPPMQGGGAAGNPSDAAVGALKQQKGETEKLTDALVWRMKQLTNRGQ